ncbi:MAG: PKD domain-containing protein, partial [bacterium]|nr:PKD domain-containing protein [bacterium]
MKKITKKIVTIILFAAVPALLFMFNLPLSADETLITIANDSELNYRKPDVQITSSGTVYVSYAAEVPDPNEVIEEIEGPHGRSSDIHLSKYEGGIVSFVKNVSESSAASYESEIAVGSNGYIHVAWCDERNGTHTILYRYYNGSSWSNITTLGSETGISYIWDLRMAVDNSGNVFVVYMKWGTAKCMFISKYGNDISFEAFPLGGRAKHPDVAVDNNYVHIVRQYRDSGSDPYTAMYNRRANQRGSSWEGAIDLDYNNVQKPRISIGSDNVPHVVFFENFGTYRTLWYKKWNGSKFDTLTEMSDSSGEYTHHFPDLIVLDSDNILATMQRGAAAGGKAIYYRWKKSGTWSGFSFFGESNGKKPSKFSVDMKNVGENLIAALAFAQSDDAVQLVLASSGSTGPSTQTPVASFTYTPQIGHMPLNVTCDAQLSSDPDGTIVSYQWAFGDGTSSTGISAQHTYTTQGQYTILLTVTDNDGLTNQVSQVVVVEPPNEDPVAAFTYSPQIGHVPLTVACNASSSSDSDGSITQYYWDFGDGSVKQGRIVQHQYTVHDDYNIELTVTDDDGATTTVSHPVVV